MSPETDVDAVTELLPAVTLVKTSAPEAAESVIPPFDVEAEVTVKPPAVSETLMEPAEVTVNDAFVAAVLRLIPEAAEIATVVADTSAVPSTVAVTDDPVEFRVTFPPPVAATLADEASVIAPPAEIASAPDVVETAALIANEVAPVDESVKEPWVVDIPVLDPSVSVPPADIETLPVVAATVALELKTTLPVVEMPKFLVPKLGLAPVANVTAPGASFSVTVKFAP